MKLFLAGLAAALAAPALAADCRLSASTSGSGLQAEYDPFSPRDMVLDLQIIAENGGADDCRALFYVAPTSGQLQLASPGGLLPYRIEGAARGSLPGEYGPFAILVPARGTRILPVRFTVRGQQVVPPDSYISEIAVRGVDAETQPIRVAGGTALMTILVSSRSEMSISGAAAPPLSAQGMAPAGIHFPAAAAGQTGRVYVNVWSNSPVSVSLTSTNGGELRMVRGPSRTPIAYTATFDGVSVPLGSIYTVGRRPTMTAQGASYELTVTLGDTSRSFAGAYRDTIRVDVDAD